MIPNTLSIIRIILVPFFLFFFFSNENNSIFFSLIIFVIASVTDFLDGFIARSFNQISNFGKFLDPLADKILTLSVFSSFLLLDIISYWMFFLITVSLVNSIKFMILSYIFKSNIDYKYLLVNNFTTFLLFFFFSFLFNFYFEKFFGKSDV